MKKLEFQRHLINLLEPEQKRILSALKKEQSKVKLKYDIDDFFTDETLKKEQSILALANNDIVLFRELYYNVDMYEIEKLKLLNLSQKLLGIVKE